MPSFKKPTINIGDRQKGRLFAISVINCSNKSLDIKESIKRVFSDKFQKDLKKTSNPYGEGGASEKITKIIANINFNNLKRKPFFDINF